MEDLLQLSLSWSNDLEMKEYVLKAISNILSFSFEHERNYIVNKMSEFDFERLFDNLVPEQQHDDYDDDVEEVYNEEEDIIAILRAIQWNLQRGF